MGFFRQSKLKLCKLMCIKFLKLLVINVTATKSAKWMKVVLPTFFWELNNVLHFRHSCILI